MHSADLKVGDRVRFQIPCYNPSNHEGIIVSKEKTLPLSKWNKKPYYNYHLKIDNGTLESVTIEINRYTWLKEKFLLDANNFGSRLVRDQYDDNHCISSKDIVCKLDAQGNPDLTTRQKAFNKKAMVKALTNEQKKDEMDKFFNKLGAMGMNVSVTNRYKPEKTTITFNKKDVEELLQYAYKPIVESIFRDDDGT